MMFVILAFLSGLVLLASLVPFHRGEAWWWRGFDFPRLQILFVALATLGLSIWRLDWSLPSVWAVVGASGLAVSIQAWWVIPYTRLFPVEVPSAEPAGGENVSFVTANVYEPNRNTQGLIDIVRRVKPDILVAMETNDRWRKALDVLEDEYPHTIKCPLDNRYGMLVYSRFQLRNPKIQYLVEDDIPSMHALAKLPSGRSVRIHFLHPAPPSPTENEESTERDAELVIVGESVKKAEAPVVVTGDLNDVAWSTTTRLFRKISGLLDPRVGRGMYCSYHAKRWYFRWPLDHLFCSSHFRLSRIERLPSYGSDHFALYMELQLASEPEAASPGLEADEEDCELAEEKKEAENVDGVMVHEPEKASGSARPA